MCSARHLTFCFSLPSLSSTMAETLLQEVAKNLARKEGKLSNVKADLAYLEEKFEWKPCSQKDEER